MQDILQEFISFLLNSWKSLIFLFVFSFVLKETIGRVVLNILRAITHLILDFSDKTVSPFNTKDWDFELESTTDYLEKGSFREVYFTYHLQFYEDSFDKEITNKKILTKYINLFERYKSFFSSSFLCAILLYSKFSTKLIKKARKNFNNAYKWRSKNQFKQIAFLLIHKFKFFFFKIYVYSKTIYVFKDKSLINHFKNIIRRNAAEKQLEEFNISSDLDNISAIMENMPFINDLELLKDLNKYATYSYQLKGLKVELEIEKENGNDTASTISKINKPFSDLSSSGASDGQELVNKINESDVLRGMKFDVFVGVDSNEKLLNTNYQVIESPNFSIVNYFRYYTLMKKEMMIKIQNSMTSLRNEFKFKRPLGDEYLCPESQELQYKYCFVSNVKIEKVIQLIDYHSTVLKIYISEGNIEESFNAYLNSKSITKEKNYYYISRLEQLKKKIDTAFKYIDYTFILFYFIISIFIEQNYFALLETRITFLLESLKSYL